MKNEERQDISIMTEQVWIYALSTVLETVNACIEVAYWVPKLSPNLFYRRLMSSQYVKTLKSLYLV